MHPPDIDKAYISPYDKLLYKFDVSHALSASQINEINKHKRIAQLRDVAATNKDDTILWDKF
jgi:hypothetical protein